MTPLSNTEIRKVEFVNTAPEDKEWTAHVKILNEWTTPDRYLREIIQYARSGKFYPADMHVNLIEQVITSQKKAWEVEAMIYEATLTRRRFNGTNYENLRNYLNGRIDKLKRQRNESGGSE